MSAIIFDQSPSSGLGASVLLDSSPSGAAVEERMLASIELAPADFPRAFSRSFTAARAHLLCGGRRVRARLALQAASALGLSTADAIALAASVELLHNASLIHDDLQDREAERRGVAAVWAAYGEDVAICAGDLLISAAYGVLASFSKPPLLPSLLSLVHQRTSDVIHGQCSELATRGSQGVDFATYRQIVVAKSGALLSLPLELAFVAAGESEGVSQARQAAADFAIGYQIVDDINDVERDAHASPPCLNALLLLRASSPAEVAQRQARELALHHLRLAATTAAGLPRGSGRQLQEFATQLAQLL